MALLKCNNDELNDIIPDVKFSRQAYIELYAIASTMRLHRHLVYVTTLVAQEDYTFSGDPELRGVACYLAMRIHKNSRDHVEEISPEHIYRELESMIKECIAAASRIIGEIDTINKEYQVSILCGVSKSSQEVAHFAGGLVQALVLKTKNDVKAIPSALWEYFEGFSPIVGNKKSPVTDRELDVLREYLGTKKTIYTCILLNCAFELERHSDSLDKHVPSMDVLVEVYKSSWMFILMECFF